mgnify:FL=1
MMTLIAFYDKPFGCSLSYHISPSKRLIPQNEESHLPNQKNLLLSLIHPCLIVLYKTGHLFCTNHFPTISVEIYTHLGIPLV